MNGFANIYLDYLSFYMESEIKLPSELTIYLEYYLNFFDVHVSYNKYKEFLNNLKRFYEKNNKSIKFSLKEPKVFLNFIKMIPKIFNMSSEIIDYFYQVIFVRENIELDNSKNYEFFLWKLEMLSYVSKNIKEPHLQKEIMSSLKPIMLKSTELSLEILKSLIFFKINNEFLSNCIAEILIDIIKEFDSQSRLLNQLNLKENLQLILIICPKLSKSSSLLKTIIMKYINDFDKDQRELSLKPQDVDLWASAWLLNPKENENFQEEMTRFLVSRFYKMDLHLLIIFAFFNNCKLIELIKYESYLYSCIKNKFVEEKTFFSSYLDFSDIFQILVKNLPYKKIPPYLEIFNDIIIEKINEIDKKQKMIEFLNKLIPFTGFAYYNNFKLMSKLDNILLEKFLDRKNFKGNRDLLEFIAHINSLKLYDFYREFLIVLNDVFISMDFITKLHFLYPLLKIYSKKDYQQLLEIFLKDLTPTNISTLINIQDIYKTLNLLIYQEMIEKMDQNALTSLFNCLQENLIKLRMNPQLYNLNIKKIKNSLQVLEILYPIIYSKLPEKLLLLINNYKDMNNEYEEKSNKFQVDFMIKLKMVQPNLKVKENFHLFGNEFECDVFIEDYKILIELCGPTHFLSNESMELNPVTIQILKLKEKVLKPKKIIIIPFFEWYNLSEGINDQKIDYIKRNIMN